MNSVFLLFNATGWLQKKISILTTKQEENYNENDNIVSSTRIQSIKLNFKKTALILSFYLINSLRHGKNKIDVITGCLWIRPTNLTNHGTAWHLKHKVCKFQTAVWLTNLCEECKRGGACNSLFFNVFA